MKKGDRKEDGKVHKKYYKSFFVKMHPLNFSVIISGFRYN